MSLSASGLRRAIAPLVLLAPFFLWGSAMVVMKGTLTDTTPLTVAIARLIPAGLVILLALAWVGKQDIWPRSRQAWGWIGLFALVDGAMFQGFLVEGLARTGAGLGSVLIDTQPLAVAVLAAVLYGDRLGRQGWLSLGLGLGGIALIGLPPRWTGTGLVWGEWVFNQGSGLMLLAALSMAVGTVMVRQVSQHVDPVVATGWHLVLGGLPLVAWSALTESHQWDHLTLTDWGGLAYVSLGGSALAYALFFYAAARENLATFSALTFLTPVFALLLGGIFLHEHLAGGQWLGVLVSLGSVYLIHQRAEDVEPAANQESLNDLESSVPASHYEVASKQKI